MKRLGATPTRPQHRRPGVERIEIEIRRVLDAIRGRDKRIHELSGLYEPPAHCCPSCASGEFRELFAKNERAAEWALILISKSGLVAHGRTAQWLRHEYPKAWRAAVGPS